MVGSASSKRVVSVISPVLLSYTVRARPVAQMHHLLEAQDKKASYARAYLRNVKVHANEHALVGQHGLRHICERGLATEKAVKSAWMTGDGVPQRRQRRAECHYVYTRGGALVGELRTFRCTPRERNGVVVSARLIRVLNMLVAG